MLTVKEQVSKELKLAAAGQVVRFHVQLAPEAPATCAPLLLVTVILLPKLPDGAQLLVIVG